MQLRQLTVLTLIVSIMVVIDAASAPVLFLITVLFPGVTADLVAPNANTIDTSVLLFRFLTMIVFARWIYVAGKNLVEAGFTDLEFSPGARIWWYVVPIAALFRPFQAMRELWNASHGDTNYTENHAILGWWWALWLISRFVLMAPESASADPYSAKTLLLAMAVSGVALAIVALMMIHRITAAQSRLSGSDLAEVFA